MINLKKMFFDFDITFTSVCRQVHGKYLKFVLLSFDTVLVQWCYIRTSCFRLLPWTWR